MGASAFGRLLPYDRNFDPRAHFDALSEYLQAEHATR